MAPAFGDVLSEQETVKAAKAAAADPALMRGNTDENPMERRIVTLVWRVAYKTTIQSKLNRSYGLIEGINSLSQINWQRQICEAGRGPPLRWRGLFGACPRVSPRPAKPP